LAEGKVIAATADSLTVRMAVPASVATGRQTLRAFGGSFEAPLQIQMVISDLEEKVATPARSRDNPQSITFPVALSGAFDRRKARDFLAFAGQARERLGLDRHFA